VRVGPGDIRPIARLAVGVIAGVLGHAGIDLDQITTFSVR